MSEQLLRDYERELAHLRRMGAEFAETHPKIAGRLRISTDTVEDPHVSRLIESVAYLNARIRRKLDDEFPELVDALLGVLYPHLLAPIPSMAIAQFECEPDLTAGFTIPRGTAVETASVRGEPCRFRTAFPVTAWPLQVVEARYASVPFAAPTTPRSSHAAAVIRIVLKTTNPSASLGEMAPKSLRFFLRGLPQHVYPLFEHVMNHVVDVAVATSVKDKKPVLLDKGCIRMVGFEEQDGLLPYSKRSFLGYRLLTEFFAFPSKFLFFDIDRLPQGKLAESGTGIELYFYLNRSSDALEQFVGKDTFALSCAPIVNLFQRHAEPIRLTQEASEYRVVADARRPLAMEVYSVDRVSIVGADGEVRPALPFYGLGHGGSPENERVWWFPVRRPSAEETEKIDHGSEVFLRLADLGFEPTSPADSTADVEVTCLNRDLPASLPFGTDEPRLQFSDGGGPIRRIRCLTPPTKTLRPPQGRSAMWLLVSQLSLNHLSLTGDEGAEALRELLSVYDRSGSRENRGMIEGLLSVSSKASAMRVISRGQPGFCRGTEVSIHLDEARFTGSGAYLFGAVLERFLGLYCSMNSFVSLTLTSTTRQEEVNRWPPRAGDRQLL